SVDVARTCWLPPPVSNTSYATYTSPLGPTATCEPWTAPSCLRGLIRIGLDQVCPRLRERDSTIESRSPTNRDQVAYTVPAVLELLPLSTASHGLSSKVVVDALGFTATGRVASAVKLTAPEVRLATLT